MSAKEKRHKAPLPETEEGQKVQRTYKEVRISWLLALLYSTEVAVAACVAPKVTQLILNWWYLNPESILVVHRRFAFC
jgi:hypothetical protein